MASGYDGHAFDGHASKRQRTDVDGHGVQSGHRVRVDSASFRPTSHEVRVCSEADRLRNSSIVARAGKVSPSNFRAKLERFASEKAAGFFCQEFLSELVMWIFIDLHLGHHLLLLLDSSPLNSRNGFVLTFDLHR